MDASPLVLAQTHARKAAKASTAAAAIEEHGLAAGQFANAAKGTEDSEVVPSARTGHSSTCADRKQAFRTLKLLEQHHEKLSQLLKFQNTHPVAQSPENVAESKSSPDQTPPPVSVQASEASPYRGQTQSLAAAHRPQRGVSSSIASNLASARGIPSNRQRRSGQASSPVLAQQHAEGKILSPPRRSRLSSPTSKSSTPTPSEKTQATPEQTAQPTPPTKESVPPAPKSDESFNRFYSTFENLFSKLSAPLAFAGLPLSPDNPSSPALPVTAASPSPQQNNPRRRPPSSRATADPDYSHLFSKAALRAVREEPGATLGTAESFYVVPTTGGTQPYASILARHHSGSHPPTYGRDSTGLSEEADEFVDARETIGPPSPGISRSKRGGGSAGGGKSMEELQLENEGLRSVLDEMSRRLWQFEMGAQMGSVALHQSIRASLKREESVGDGAAGGSGGAGVEGGKERVGKLEEEMGSLRRDMERMGKENEKLKGVVGRYRERWEKLKEGARVRREGGGGGGGGGGRGEDGEG